MKAMPINMGRRFLAWGLLCLGLFPSISAQTLPPPGTNSVEQIDLLTSLRLANARNLDLQIARERLAEAHANYDSAVAAFLPWFSPGAAYRGHNNLFQDAPGNLIDADKDAYGAGLAVTGQWELGEAIFKRLSARQTANAATHALRAEENDITYAAAQAYFDLLKARVLAAVALDSIRISTNYLAQVEQASTLGLAYKSDVLRVRVQAERNQTAWTQAHEAERVASSRLAQVLHLNGTIELAANPNDLVPLQLAPTNIALETLVSRAIAARPELKESQALIAAARKNKDAVVYGPLVPNISALAYAGGLGGGRRHSTTRFGDSEDYQVTLGWRIGPGGLFDKPRQRGAEARLHIAQLTSLQWSDRIANEVIEAQAAVQSLASQLGSTLSAWKAAQETLALSEQRREFAIANVLEVIQAQQELTRAQREYSVTIADYNQAQYRLIRTLGEPR